MHKGMIAVLAALSCTFAGACERRAPEVGHWEWQGNGHVWVPAHATLPPQAYAWRDDAPPSPVREVANAGDQRDAREQPRDLGRRFTR